jgi:hypothetical protein
MRLIGKSHKALVHLLAAEVDDRWDRVRRQLDGASEDDLPNICEDIAEFALEINDELRRERILEQLVALTKDIKNSEIRADLIGRLASMLATSPGFGATPRLFDELIAAASKIHGDEARIETLAGNIDSVAVALAKSGDSWAHERLERLVLTARKLRSIEKRVEFLTNLVGALKNVDSPTEWALHYCGLILEEITRIRNVEARIEGLSDLAEAVSELGSVSWQEPIFSKMMEAAEGTGHKEEQLVAVIEVAKAAAKAGAEHFLQSFVTRKLSLLNDETQSVVIGGLSARDSLRRRIQRSRGEVYSTSSCALRRSRIRRLERPP